MDDELVKKEIREQLQQILKDTHELWLWDVDMLAKKTCMSQTFLEEEFLSDPRMKKIEIRKSRKRWYPVDAAKEVLMNIMSEW